MLRTDPSGIRVSSESGLILSRKNAAQTWKDNPYQHHCALWSCTTALFSGLLCLCVWGPISQCWHNMQNVGFFTELETPCNSSFCSWGCPWLSLFCFPPECWFNWNVNYSVHFFSKRDLIQADLSILYMPKTLALKEWSKFAVPSFK